MATLATEGVESEAAAGRDGPGRPWWRRPFWLVVFGLTAVSVLLSVSHIYAYRNDVQTLFLETGGTVETKLRGDGWVFHEEANNLADGLGLIDPAVYRDFGLSREVAQHPPLYLAYLTAFSHLGVRGELSHMLLTVPLGASAVAAFALLGRRVAGDTVGLLAGAYAALAPSIWPSPGFLISESLVVPLAALLALSVYRFMDRPTIGRALGMGGIAGLATLTRGELAFYVVIVIIPVVLLGIRSLDFRRRLALLVATGAACGAVVLPWVGYNVSRLEEPVLISVGLDWSLAQGNCPESYGSDFLGYYWLPCLHRAFEGQVTEDGTDLSLADQSLGAIRAREVAFEFIADNPRRAVLAVGARLGRITGVFHPVQQAQLNALIAGREPWIANLTVLFWYPAASAAIIGAVLLRRRAVPILPLVGLVAVSLLATAMTLAVLRYRAPMEPAIAVLAAVTVERAWRFLRAGWWDQAAEEAQLPVA